MEKREVVAAVGRKKEVRGDRASPAPGGACARTWMRCPDEKMRRMDESEVDVYEIE